MDDAWTAGARADNTASGSPARHGNVCTWRGQRGCAAQAVRGIPGQGCAVARGAAQICGLLTFISISLGGLTQLQYLSGTNTNTDGR